MLSIGLFCLTAPLYAFNNAVTNISTCAELQNIRTDLAGNYILVANVSCNGVDFVPIGSANTPFTGTLDGAGYNIKDLSIKSSGSYLGLFAVASIASIKNLTLVNAQINGSYYVGALVGHAKQRTTIVNVQVQNGTIMVPANHSSQYVGGMVGLLDSGSTINNSATSALVQGGGSIDRDMGGLVGSINDSNVYTSHATGAVQGSGVAMGGLAGSLNGRSESSSRYHSSVKDCSATGAVTEIRSNIGPNTRDMGGLIGYVYHSRIYNSYASGAVTGANGSYNIGGFAGELVNDCLVQNSYASGSVSGTQYIGGLIGSIQTSSITHAYAAGHVYGTTNVGGLIGYAYKPTTSTDGYWDIQTSGQLTSAGGLGRSTVEMYRQAMYGWDFAKVWDIHEGEGYPFLLWQK